MLCLYNYLHKIYLFIYSYIHIYIKELQNVQKINRESEKCFLSSAMQRARSETES